jgi:cytochrome c556
MILSAGINEYFKEVIKQAKDNEPNDNEKIRQQEAALVEQVDKFKKKQIKRIKSGESKTRNSILYLNILEETRKMVIYTHSVIKALDELFKHKP